MSETPMTPALGEETDRRDMVACLTEAVSRQSETIAAQADQIVALCRLNAELTRHPPGT